VMTLRDAIYCDVMPCGCCKNRLSSETSVLTRLILSNIPEDGILPFLVYERVI
jgi:hypothetical protein